VARELVRLDVDLLFVAGDQGLGAAKEATDTIPILLNACDPLEKLVVSIARPAGKVTGATCISSDLAGKRLQMLKEIVGRARFEHAEPEAAIRLELPATHEKAFLDDPTVPDRVKPDLIEVDAFLALWRDIQLEANDELIPVPQGGGRKNPMVEREPRSS
jgi:hypothetical protein